MRQVCSVASDYLGVPDNECLLPFDSPVEKQPGGSHSCSYYSQKEGDPDHPSVLPRVCGNCIHWVVLEE